jgi:hypothetical protein
VLAQQRSAQENRLASNSVNAIRNLGKTSMARTTKFAKEVKVRAHDFNFVDFE